MSQRDVQLAHRFASQSGLATLHELLDLGFSRQAVYRRVRVGELAIVQPGVFRSAHHAPIRQQELLAACLRNPLAVIGEVTAAQEWRFRRLMADDGVYVLVPQSSSPELRGVIVRRVRNLDPTDIVQRDDGVRLTSPARTLFDIAPRVGDAAATSILEQIIDAGHGSLITHLRTLARLGHTRRPGTATMARVIAARADWSAALQSDLEARVLAEIHRQGLPAPVTQFRVLLSSGRVAVFDFAWPHLRRALEVDHPFWHAGAARSHDDKARDREAEVDRWRTTRITDLDVEVGLPRAIGDVGLILANIRAA